MEDIPFEDFDLAENEDPEDWAAFLEDVNPTAFAEDATLFNRESNQPITGSRLYVSVISVEGPHGEPGARYSVRCSMDGKEGKDNKKLHKVIPLDAGESEHVLTDTSGGVVGWDIFEYYGCTSLHVVLQREVEDKSWLSSARRLLRGCPPEELVSAALSLSQVVAAIGSGSVSAGAKGVQRWAWGYPARVRLLPPQQSSDAASGTNRGLFSSLGLSFSSSSGSGSGSSSGSSSGGRARASSSLHKFASYLSLANDTPHAPTPSPATAVLQVHLLPLQHCLDLAVPSALSAALGHCEALRASPPGPHAYTEMHVAAASGCRFIVEDLLVCLALQGKIRTCLGMRSSPGRLSVLEVALLSAGSQQGACGVVRSLLTRAGNLCFQGSLQGDGGFTAVHAALLGGSVDCLRMLLRFLERHGHTVVGLGSSPERASETTGPVPPTAGVVGGVDVLGAVGGNGVVEAVGGDGAGGVPGAAGGGEQPAIVPPVASPVTAPAHAASPLRADQLLSWPDDAGMSPAALLCALPCAPSDQANSAALLSALITAGCEVGLLAAQGSTRKTPLMLACERGNLLLVERLLSVTAAASQTDPQSEAARALCFVASHALSYECAPYAKDRRGWTALSYAISGGHESIAQLLLALTFSIVDTTDDGQSVLHLCAEGGHAALCAVLVAREQREWDEHVARYCGAQALLSRQYRPRLLQARDGRGRTPEAAARAGGHDEVAAMLKAAAAAVYATSDGVGDAQRKGEAEDDEGGGEGEMERERREESDYAFALMPKPKNLGYYSRTTNAD